MRESLFFHRGEAAFGAKAPRVRGTLVGAHLSGTVIRRSRVGEVARQCAADFISIFGKFAISQWVDVGIEPYEAREDSIGNFELLQASRERSKKTEAVFLVGSRRSGGKSKSLRAHFLLPAFSFGEAKENAVLQSHSFKESSYVDKYLRCRYSTFNSSPSKKSSYSQ